MSVLNSPIRTSPRATKGQNDALEIAFNPRGLNFDCLPCVGLPRKVTTLECTRVWSWPYGNGNGNGMWWRLWWDDGIARQNWVMRVKWRPGNNPNSWSLIQKIVETLGQAWKSTSEIPGIKRGEKKLTGANKTPRKICPLTFAVMRYPESNAPSTVPRTLAPIYKEIGQKLLHEFRYISLDERWT